MHTPFLSIAAQAAKALREEVNRSSGGPLPSERELTQRLQVSRRTIRKALAILRREGVVRLARRRSIAVPVKSGSGAAPTETLVGLLLPEPLENARPFTTLWINQLAALLQESGSRLEIIPGEKYYGNRSGRTLRNLVTSRPMRCWVLARSNRPLQQWFCDSGVPTVVAGTAHPGITLPSVDTDHMALGRHAAAQLIRRGHTRLGLFLEKFQHGGDAETAQGFRQALGSAAGMREPTVSRVERTPQAVIAEVQRLLALRFPPTGLLLCNSFSYLTLQTYLMTRGYRIPQDFSLLSQDEGPFLAHVYPTPARYVTNAKKFAAALNRAVKGVLANDLPRDAKLRIIPDFVPGGSIGDAPARVD